jgi:hypothetical protein
MISCMASAVWSRPIFSSCYTEHGQCCGAVLSGRITIVAMSRSGQLDLRCTVEPNYSDISLRLAGVSITRDRALDTCEPSCVPGAARHLFIHVVHSPPGLCGTWLHRSSRLRETRPVPRGSAGAHLDREVRSGAEEHVTTPELSSRADRARSYGTRGSAGAHLDKKAMSGAE